MRLTSGTHYDILHLLSFTVRSRNALTVVSPNCVIADCGLVVFTLQISLCRWLIVELRICPNTRNECFMCRV